MMTSINQITQDAFKKMNHSVFFENSLASTNDKAKVEFPNTNSSFSLYLTDHQTHGRGRNKKEWFDLSKGETLLSTWCFKLQQNPQPILTPLLGLALYNSLLKFNPELPLRIKPPNDLYLNEGKLSGLLVEMSQMGPDFFLYVGLGLNAFASPNIDIKTSTLFESSSFEKQKWSLLCHDLYINFNEAIKKGFSTELLHTDRLSLLKALNNNVPQSEQYIDISPLCDLYTESGKISWMDL